MAMTIPEDGDDAALQARLKSLSSALEGHAKGAAQERASAADAGPDGIGKAINLGFRVMTEFVAAVLVGGVIGWSIDRWLGSSPAGLIVFVALGTAAGFWSVYRMAAKPPGAPRGR